MDLSDRTPLSASQFDHLVGRARGGDVEALGTLLESCRQYLSLLANRELGVDLRPKLGGSDVVQKTFLDVQQDFERFRGDSPGEFYVWVERILLNNLADYARQYRQTDKRQVEREVSLDMSSTPLDLAADESSPSQQAIAREENAQLVAAIGRLPQDYQQVIRLRNQERRPFDEIGHLMKRSTEAVKKLWGRAILQLEKEMKRKD